MGLLDDAIREHLDLKRRRGADPTEIERAEREALGPVRRVGEEAESAELQLGAHDDEEHAHAADDGEREAAPQLDWHEPEGPAEHEPVVAEHEALIAEHEPETAAAPELSRTAEPDIAPASEPDLVAPVRAPDEHEDDDFGSWSPATQSGPGGAETIEYDVEEALDSEHGEQGDDVLEETPEFLQDTPDHDRLWFEQKPPRDFDFDG
jgi:hypothetical protein